MRRFNPQIWLGGLLVLGGILALLDSLGVISNSGGIFWGLIFAAGSATLFYLLFTYRSAWWIALPAFLLLGLAARAFLPPSLDTYERLVFFVALSFGFWWVYATQPTHWWAIIPAGILLTLALVSVVDNAFGVSQDGLLFLGMGLTFVLVTLLPGGKSRQWAYYPGAALLIFGALFGVSKLGLNDYFVPAVLIILGVILVILYRRYPAPR